MSDHTIGTCSLCGGRVVLYGYQVNPVPQCTSCGARKKQPHGPVIEMEKLTPVKAIGRSIDVSGICSRHGENIITAIGQCRRCLAEGIT